MSYIQITAAELLNKSHQAFLAAEKSTALEAESIREQVRAWEKRSWFMRTFILPDPFWLRGDQRIKTPTYSQQRRIAELRAMAEVDLVSEAQ